jgi:hypothetical protein
MRDRPVTNGVNTLMQTVQAAPMHAKRHRVPSQPGRLQLSDRHNTVLTLGDPRHGCVWTGAFLPHTGIKSPGASDSPPASASVEDECRSRHATAIIRRGQAQRPNLIR